MPHRTYDAIVVGSGFGGSVAAYRLAEAGLRVALLERGRRYPPGAFPRSPREMSQNFWDPSAGLYGMFDLWSFRGLDALVASGLGGGSLIYANVLLRKDEHWFVRNESLPGGGEEDWPLTRADLDPHYDRAEAMLSPSPYPAHVPPYSETSKTCATRDGATRAGLDWQLPPLAVSFASRAGAPPVPGVPIHEPHDNLHKAPRVTCRLCGECDIGCNFGSKNTLDFNYLSAADRAGAEIHDQTEVTSFGRRPDGRFFVRTRSRVPPSDPADPRTERRLERTLVTKRLVLGAGALGSTFLLLRNRRRFPGLSPMLGERFCGNGDLLGFLRDVRAPDGAPDSYRALAPERGPVITTALRLGDFADGDTGRGCYLEEGGFPLFASWMAEGRDLPGYVRRGLSVAKRFVENRLARHPRRRVSAELAAVFGGRDRAWASLPMLGMGRDIPDGTLSLDQRFLASDWTVESSRAYFARLEGLMARLAEGLGGAVDTSPLSALGRVITVHPLGGCPTGRDPSRGVVDPWGAAYHEPGLYVADGSALPGPVGANPSLTIAAFADRVADRIVAHHERGTP